MSETVSDLRETALHATYSSDRESAIETLAEVYDDVGESDRRRILETLREVVKESTYADERTAARERIAALFERDPDTAAAVAVRTHCYVAREARGADERRAAMDALVGFHRQGIPEDLTERIRETLSTVAEEATSRRDRERARDRLSDLVAAGGDSGGTGADGEGTAAYLAGSLAEHLAAAADEGPEACLQRAEELADFLAEHPLDDDAFEDVRSDLDRLIDQLEVAPTGDELDAERRERVERLAERIERTYRR